MITITIESTAVQAALTRLQARLGDLTPVMHDIGQALVEGTRERINIGQDWGGHAFAPNSAATLARKKGSKPLINEGNLVANRLHFAATASSVAVQSSAVQSAVLQFGAKAGAFGRSKRGGKLPWGDIPARPFMPLEGQNKLPAAAEALVLAEINAYLDPTP